MSISEFSINSTPLPPLFASDELPLHVQAGLHGGLRHIAHLAHHSHRGVHSLQVRWDALALEIKGAVNVCSATRDICSGELRVAV